MFRYKGVSGMKAYALGNGLRNFALSYPINKK